MHGYGGSKSNVTQDLRELAAKGVLAVAPDMRGCGQSAGKWDSGGLDVHDILDAVLAAVRRYPAEVDPRNLNVVGYSGGGGNAIACAVRFPDLFQTCVSFFGISDYGWWHQSEGRPDCNARMEKALGGPPAALPAVYAARNANPAAGNARASRLHFFWDEEEKACPPGMIEIFLENYHKAGLKHATAHVSRRADPHRWIHNYRSGNPSLSDPADALFLPDVMAPKKTPPRLPARGRLVVPGYLVARRFAVWIGDGQQGQVTVEYDQSGPVARVKVAENPGGYAVRCLSTSPLQSLL
jgi:pimeloyl-ACP methyl ester carboxylesterase